MVACWMTFAEKT